MKPNLKRLTYFVVIVALFVLIPTMGITASAYDANINPDDYVDANGYYTVTECCGESGVTLGTFNGSSACISASGELHICAKNFPDNSFRAYFIQRYKNTSADASSTAYYFSSSEVDAITELSPGVYSAGDHSTYKGIEYFVNLKKLDMSERYVEHIELSRNVNLEEFIAPYNHLTEIDFTNNTKLKKINLRTDYEAFKKINKLDISMLPDLEELDIFFQNISSLDVTQNTKLKKLNVSNCHMGQLDLTNCTLLEELNAMNANFDSIDLSKCVELTTVCVESNENLTELDISKNVKLVDLDASMCNLSALDTSNNPLLEMLDVSSNHILGFDFSNNPALKVGNRSYVSISSQSRRIDILDKKADLSKIEGFDFASVVNTGTYNFIVRQNRNAFTNNEALLLTEPIVPINKASYDEIFFTISVKSADGSKYQEAQISLGINKRYYTVNFVGEGVDVHAYEWMTGVGEKVTTMIAESSCDFDVFVKDNYQISESGLVIEYQVGDETSRRTATEVTGREGDKYWLAGQISAPTTVYISGVEYVGGEIEEDPESTPTIPGNPDNTPSETPNETPDENEIDRVVNDRANAVVNVPEGSNAYVPAGTIFEVVALENEDVSEETLGEIAIYLDGSPDVLAFYDMSLLLEGAPVQPNGVIMVTIPAVEVEYDTIKVVYIDDNGNFEECATTINEDGTITFETDHFSKYAVIGVNNKGLSGGAIAGIVIGSVAGVILLAVGGFAIFWFVIKKKTFNELLAILKKN